MNKGNRFGRKAGLALVAALAAGSASAAVDVTAVTTEIGTATAPIAAIGAAVLLVLVATKIYKWVRRAM